MGNMCVVVGACMCPHQGGWPQGQSSNNTACKPSKRIKHTHTHNKHSTPARKEKGGPSPVLFTVGWKAYTKDAHVACVGVSSHSSATSNTHTHAHTATAQDTARGSAGNQLLPAGPSKQPGVPPATCQSPSRGTADRAQQGRLQKGRSKPRLMCSHQSSTIAATQAQAYVGISLAPKVGTGGRRTTHMYGCACHSRGSAHTLANQPGSKFPAKPSLAWLDANTPHQPIQAPDSSAKGPHTAKPP